MRWVMTWVLLLPLGLSAVEKSRPIDLVLCLDTSNSMDGLLDSTQRQLWSVVNQIAHRKPTPDLRVGIYTYGNNSYKVENGFVRLELQLSSDLDLVYKKLHDIRVTTIAGSEEYPTRVGLAALKDLAWSKEADATRILFICGNESVDQDPLVKRDEVAKLARQMGVCLNTIYCGPSDALEARGWEEFARQAGGKFAGIDMNRARAAAVATPFDSEIARLGLKLNDTYLPYGGGGEEKRALQSAQDSNAGRASAGVLAERSITKAGALYKNSTWDLVDRLRDDKSFDLSKLKEDELPEALRKLKPEERSAFIRRTAAQRQELQEKIQSLGVERAKHLATEREKQPKSLADKAFDEAIQAILQAQIEATGRKNEK